MVETAPASFGSDGRPFTRREFVAQGGRAALLLATGSTLLDGRKKVLRPQNDLGQLARVVSGPIVVTGEAGYRQAKLLYNPTFNAATPRAVVYCQTPQDVVATIDFVRSRGLTFAARSGGHSFGGYSVPDGGIVADVSRLRRIRIDRSRKSAVLGPGVLNMDMYTGLGRQGLAIPGGTCPTVGVGGLTLGGGFGFSSRQLGLTTDNLIELELVTASGERLTCNAEQHPDLFWACRGGGGGNFGVVTSMRFGVHPVGDVAFYTLSWRWSDAPGVVDAWQRWATAAPDALFSTCNLSRTGGPSPTGPTVSSQGQYFGSPAQLAALLEPLLAVARPTHQQIGKASFAEVQHRWADCQPGHCHDRSPNPYTVKTDFFTDPLPQSAISVMTEALDQWPGSLGASPGVGVELNSWGGAIGRVPPSATAFVHRDAQFLAIYGTTWSAQDAAARVAANHGWLKDLYARMRPFASGFAYQNLIDPHLADWLHAYYGSNLAELVAVKRRYDPQNFFHFAQSIPLSL